MFEELTENLLETPLVTNGDFLSLLWHFLLNWVQIPSFWRILNGDASGKFHSFPRNDRSPPP